MDKWVPGLCLVFSAVLGSTAYFLYSTQISDAFGTNTKNISEAVVNFQSVRGLYKTEINKLDNENKRILIVPGHDKENYGAKFNSMKEEVMNLKLGKLIYDELATDDSFEVFITRDENGYTNDFYNYFENEEDINYFIKKHKLETNEKIKTGEFEPVNVVEHNPVPRDVAYNLYAINKWVNENDIDLVLHIHFNDYPRKNREIKGKYEGFSIYIPSNNLKQGGKSRVFAEILKNELETFFSPSNLTIEKDTIIENSDLIAIGSNNTLSSASSVLIEYGYIYEDIFNEENIDYVFELIKNKTIKSIKNLNF